MFQFSFVIFFWSEVTFKSLRIDINLYYYCSVIKIKAMCSPLTFWNTMWFISHEIITWFVPYYDLLVEDKPISSFSGGEKLPFHYSNIVQFGSHETTKCQKWVLIFRLIWQKPNKWMRWNWNASNSNSKWLFSFTNSIITTIH